MEIIKALKESGLTGLGGAGYPTWQKWQAVKDSDDRRRFLICNTFEGEPDVFKDEYILTHHLKELVLGIELAAETVSVQKSFIFLNDKYKKYFKKIKRAIAGKKIEIFIGTGGYLCGEETTLLQVMEGKLRQPRMKPPFPTEVGLYGCPTLINNAETLYRAYLVSQGGYQPKRFFSVSNDSSDKKIVEADVGEKISEIIGPKLCGLARYVRVGGPSGYFLPKEKFDQKITGTGAIKIYGQKSKIMSGLVDSVVFLKSESCGKCTPCREGSYRIAEKINQLQDCKSLWDRREIIEIMAEIAKTAERSSFCALGKSLASPVLSAIENFKQELVGE